MPVVIPDLRLPDRSRSWKWWVCGLLLLATMINYMDRLTLNLMAVRIMEAFGLNEQQYGRVESAFAVAFALGALLMGWLADRVNVRWLYAAAVLAWSVAGFATGFAQGFVSLLVCRFLLGLAESGNWPCALRTTQHILTPAERTMGNGILQSGAAFGAILTPLIVLVLLRWTGTWRFAFWVVGGCGVSWVVLWFLLVRPRDLALPARSSDPGAAKAGGPPRGQELPPLLFIRRFLVLAVLVVMINSSWHFFRAWLPLILERQHHYSEAATSLFMSAYYVATDLGSLAAGFATLYLARRGLSVHGSRLLVFFLCSLLTALSLVVATLPPGPLLLGLLLVIGFGALGVFPNYYSFSQELTVRHQGKVTGALGCCCWLAMAGLHELVGRLVTKTGGSYTTGVALAGLAPLVGFLTIALFWGPTRPARPETPGVAEEEKEALPDGRIQAAPEPVEQRLRRG
jgi:ACS family hexuronate transporter-like MFS transporter